MKDIFSMFAAARPNPVAKCQKVAEEMGLECEMEGWENGGIDVSIDLARQVKDNVDEDVWVAAVNQYREQYDGRTPQRSYENAETLLIAELADVVAYGMSVED